MFNQQKKYFKQKLYGVQRMIWDSQFKRFKTLEIREDVRQEYDKSKARLEITETQVKSQKENSTMEAGDVAKLEDQIVMVKRDIKRYESQLKAMDLDVFGSKPTNEFPDGISGINDQLDSLRELQIMIKEYIKSL